MEKLMKSEVCGPINSARIHYLLLTWLTTITEAKKKRGEEGNVDLKRKLGSKLTLKFPKIFSQFFDTNLYFVFF